jgi:hypothetical protein
MKAINLDSDYLYSFAVELTASLLPIWVAYQVAKSRYKKELKYPSKTFPNPSIKINKQIKFFSTALTRSSGWHLSMSNRQNLLKLFPTFVIVFNVSALKLPGVAFAALLWVSVGFWLRFGTRKGPSAGTAMSYRWK